MKIKSFIRAISGLMIAAFLLCLIPGKAYAVSQEEIDELRRQRLAIAMEHDEKQAEVDELQAERANILQRKQAMDERNALTRQEIEAIQKEIELYDQMIAEQAIRLEQARAYEARQLERYRMRVRAMEEDGEFDYISLFLNATDLGDFLTMLDDAGDIMKSDEELYQDYIRARINTERVKAEYESTKDKLEQEQAELRARQAMLQAEIEEATQLVTSLDEDIEEREQELQELLLAEIATAERIDRLVEQQERERREAEERRRREEEARQREQGGGSTAPAENGGGGGDSGGGGGNDGGSAASAPVTGTGSWSWPCPGCYYITSRFGNRYHPIFNEWRYHSGLDIGAGYGSGVTAADSGTVIMASVNGGYGNCVMIDHGNGYYTLYGHLSGYAVSNGQSVSKGQTIGYVGDTGWATGPHLHFEVRSGSTKLDPETTCGFYGLTFAPDAGE